MRFKVGNDGKKFKMFLWIGLLLFLIEIINIK